MDRPDTFVASLKSKETAGASSEVQLIFSLLSKKIPFLACLREYDEISKK